MGRARSRRGITLLAAAAFAIAGCGGGGEDPTSTATVTAGGTGGTGSTARAQAKAAQSCLEDAGLDVSTEKPTTKGMVASLYVNADTVHQVYVAFMEDADAAKAESRSLTALGELIGGNAGPERIGDTIVLGKAKRTTPADVAQVKDCLQA